MKNSLLIANLSALLATSLWGGSVVATRVVVQQVPPITLAVLRFGQGSLALIGLLLLVAPPLLMIRRRDLVPLLLAGFVIFTCFSLLFNLSLRLTEAARGALMLATTPLWSVLIGRVFSGERLSVRQISGIVLSVAGIALSLLDRGLVFGGDMRQYLGDGLMLLAALCIAIYGVLARRLLRRYRALTVITYAMLLGTLLLVPFVLLETPLATVQALDRQTVLLLVFLGVLGGALAHFLWVQSLASLAATQVAVYINLNPLVAAVLGAWLLREDVSLVFWGGFAMVLVGVLLVNLPARAR